MPISKRSTPLLFHRRRSQPARNHRHLLRRGSHARPRWGYCCAFGDDVALVASIAISDGLAALLRGAAPMPPPRPLQAGKGVSRQAPMARSLAPGLRAKLLKFSSGGAPPRSLAGCQDVGLAGVHELGLGDAASAAIASVFDAQQRVHSAAIRLPESTPSALAWPAFVFMSRHLRRRSPPMLEGAWRRRRSRRMAGCRDQLWPRKSSVAEGLSATGQSGGFRYLFASRNSTSVRAVSSDRAGAS